MVDIVKMAVIIRTMVDSGKIHRHGQVRATTQTETSYEGWSRPELAAKTILQSLPVGLIIFDEKLKILESNPRAAEMVSLETTIDRSLRNGAVKNDTDETGWAGDLKSVISKGRIRWFDDTAYTKDGETKYLNICCMPIKPVQGQTKTAMAIIEDVTEQVNLRKKLVDAERLATVGRLVSKVVHELNGPIDGILRYINLAIRTIEQKDLEKPKKYLIQCQKALIKMTRTASELLQFSRSSSVSLEYVQIEQIIEDAIRLMVAEQESSKIRIRREYTSGIPLVRKGKLFQVFCNLIKNAVDAMSGSGRLEISTHQGPANTAIIRFQDTGTGLPQEKTDMIFEPFFTTKKQGKGTGLGLAICRDIIQRYNGRITAENAPEGGSVFTVSLPVQDKSAETEN